MENKYAIDFESKVEDYDFFDDLNSVIGKQIGNFIEPYYNNLNSAGRDAFLKCKVNKKLSWMLQRYHMDKEFIDKLNNVLYKAFKKYKEDSNLFSLDEQVRFKTLVKICNENPNDEKLQDLEKLVNVFGISKNDEINKAIEEHKKAIEEHKKAIEQEKIAEQEAKKAAKEAAKAAKEAEKKAKKAAKDKTKVKKTKSSVEKKDEVEVKVEAKEVESASKVEVKEDENTTKVEVKENMNEPEETTKVEVKEETQEEVKDNKEQDEIISYSAAQLRNSISNATFLGRAIPSTLKQDKDYRWIVSIKPRDIMFKDAIFSDMKGLKSELSNPIDMNFLCFLEEEDIEELDIDELKNLETDDQADTLYELLENRDIIFDAYVSEPRPDDHKRRLQARNLGLCDTTDDEFATPVLVPVSPYSLKELERKIVNKEYITLVGYSGCLHTSLKYILVDGNLYQVNLKPTLNDEIWKSKDGAIKLLANNFIEEHNQDLYLFDSKMNKNNVSNEFCFVKDKVLTALKNNVFIENSNTKNNVEEDVTTENISEVKQVEPLPTIAISESDFIEAVYDRSQEQHLNYSKNDIVNFHIALKTSQLVILAGSSGTGKTQLPFVYTKTLNMDENRGNVLFVPISPSYTEPSDILGYLKPNITNGLEASNNTKAVNATQYDGSYVESETGLVSFLNEASKNRDKLYACVFDEMNLSQIEYWFSPFMSILERRGESRILQLYSDSIKCSNSDIFPSHIEIGDNVLFIGTINLDETTKELSDRLIDRAIIINLEKKSILQYFEDMKKVNELSKPKSVNNKLFFTFRKNVENYITIFTSKEIEFFEELNKYINEENSQKELSFRTLKTIANYLKNAENLENYISRSKALDFILKETIIMKIKGSDNSVRKMLDKETGIINILGKFPEISDFKETKAALERKLNELNNYGYTR